jgi:hypothetical protein
MIGAIYAAEVVVLPKLPAGNKANRQVSPQDRLKNQFPENNFF